MRLLYARAIDEARTAIVIDFHGEILGGVAWMTEIKVDRYYSEYHRAGPDTVELKLVWEWWQYFDSVDAYERSRAWENPPAQIAPMPALLEGPTE